MPKTTRSGTARQSEIPSTLRRSPAKAQRTFAKAYDSAVETYDGDESRAARTAYTAVKHSFEKVGDHWEEKDRPGPSEEPAGRSGSRARREQPTAGGVDTTASKKHLYELARRLDVAGRSRMSKDELVAALQAANRKATARAR